MSKGTLAAIALAVAAFIVLVVAGVWALHARSHRVYYGNESSAIGCLRTMTTAQALFREGDKDRNCRLDYAASIDALVRAGLLASRRCGFPGCRYGVEEYDNWRGYRVRILEGSAFTWSAQADPVFPGRSGDRYFFVDESGVIRFATTGPATAKSTAIGG